MGVSLICRGCARRKIPTSFRILCHCLKASVAVGRDAGSTCIMLAINGRKRATFKYDWDIVRNERDCMSSTALTWEIYSSNICPRMYTSVLNGSYGTVRESSGTVWSSPSSPNTSLLGASAGILMWRYTKINEMLKSQRRGYQGRLPRSQWNTIFEQPMFKHRVIRLRIKGGCIHHEIFAIAVPTV